MKDEINSEALRKMFLAGTAALESKKEWINELNVFPVPDGDTGTNMTLTLRSAAGDLVNLPENAGMERVCKIISTGTLKGARGNSGVIMSQLCRGFTKAVETKDKIDKMTMAAALERAVATAYKAVMKPKEGTILTVAKALAGKAAELAGTDISMAEFMEKTIIAAEEMLEKTPDLLPVLKEAGVVDSGGQGLVEFLKGAADCFNGKEIEFAAETTSAPAARTVTAVNSSNIETADIKFGYCTEFILKLEKPFTEKDEEEMKDYYLSLGDSLVLVAMDDMVKVHVHTNHPGLAFEKALEYGSLTSMKVDNMREEHNEKVIHEQDRELAEEKERQKKEAESAKNTPHKQYGFVAVCQGEGFAEIYKGMDVDVIVEGGQTMNPSSEDFAAAIGQINADTVFIFPNNSNVLMAASQSAYLCEGVDVRVIPTKTVAQGITALFNFGAKKSADENEKDMTESLSLVKTLEITYAVRDTEIDGKVIHENDIMGIGDGHIRAVGQLVGDTAAEAVMEAVDDDTEIITVYYGCDSTEEDGNTVAADREARLGSADIDIEVLYGGQSVYYYIISVE